MAYAPIIVPADLNTQMYPEVRTLITRNDNNIATSAIDSAITEVKMFLGKYDLAALFGDTAANTAATYSDQFLKEMVKTVAIWNLLRLAAPNVDMSVALTRYDQVMTNLRNIQKGMADPAGWPLRDTTNSTTPNGNAVEYTSRKRKNNYW